MKKIGDKQYEIFCSVCGKSAVKFKAEIPKFEKEEKLIYYGITHGDHIDLKHEKDIFELLEKKDISSLHSYLVKTLKMPEGLDAYCPECDRVYCEKHYNLSVVFDEGFYDCSYGTCPKGHRRKLDD